MTLKIKGEDITPKYGFKAMMMYERILGTGFEPKTLGDIITFFYCCVLAAGVDVPYEEFIDILDENPEKLNEFTTWLQNSLESKTLKKTKGKAVRK